MGALEVELAMTLSSSSSSFLSSFLLTKERERERIPKEQRAETQDNSRCFPGAYRRRGPTGFVSCGCSCLWAKWTTVDLTLDLSSFLCPFISLSLCALSLCLSCSIIPFTVLHFLPASLSYFLDLREYIRTHTAQRGAVL